MRGRHQFFEPQTLIQLCWVSAFSGRSFHRLVATATMNKPLPTLFLFLGIVAAGWCIGFRIVHIPNQLLSVILLALIVFYPVMRFPLIGVYLLFIIMPIIPLVRRFFYLSHGRPGIDPLIILGDLILGITVLGLFFTFREQVQQGKFRHGIVVLVLFYFCYLLLRTFVANELPAGIALLRFRFYGPQVLLFFVGMVYALHKDHLNRLWGITIAIGIGAVLYGIKQSLFGYNEAEKIWFSSIDFTSLFIKGIARPFSFFQSPAAFADYVLLSVVSVIFFAGYARIAGKMLMLLIPLFWAGVLITSVRSCWIGMALTFFVWLLIVRIKGMKQRLMVFSIATLCFILFDVLQAVVQTGIGFGSFVSSISGNQQTGETINLLVTERADAIENPFQEHSMVSRIGLWKYIFNLSFNPYMAVLGRGIGVLSADSMYVTYLAELGYPGVIFLLALLVLLVRKGFQVVDGSRSKWAVSLAVAVVTMDIVMAIIGLTGSHIHAFPGDSYFWFWNGVMMGLWAELKNREEPEGMNETAADA
ncbi:MAG: hypothetical protein JXA71_16565 [Chitinispirillaceae bacterium]|nr:hypothetical protein [Chitinispirillaceae bacterium]